MTKGEAYLRAWKLGFKGDFSEIDKIYHPEYSAVDDATGVKVDLNMDYLKYRLWLNSLIILKHDFVFLHRPF